MLEGVLFRKETTMRIQFLVIFAIIILLLPIQSFISRTEARDFSSEGLKDFFTEIKSKTTMWKSSARAKEIELQSTEPSFDMGIELYGISPNAAASYTEPWLALMANDFSCSKFAFFETRIGIWDKISRTWQGYFVKHKTFRKKATDPSVLFVQMNKNKDLPPGIYDIGVKCGIANWKVLKNAFYYTDIEFETSGDDIPCNKSHGWSTTQGDVNMDGINDVIVADGSRALLYQNKGCIRSVEPQYQPNVIDIGERVTKEWYPPSIILDLELVDVAKPLDPPDGLSDYLVVAGKKDPYNPESSSLRILAVDYYSYKPNFIPVTLTLTGDATLPDSINQFDIDDFDLDGDLDIAIAGGFINKGHPSVGTAKFFHNVVLINKYDQIGDGNYLSHFEIKNLGTYAEQNLEITTDIKFFDVLKWAYIRESDHPKSIITSDFAKENTERTIRVYHHNSTTEQFEDVTDMVFAPSFFPYYSNCATRAMGVAIADLDDDNDHEIVVVTFDEWYKDDPNINICDEVQAVECEDGDMNCYHIDYIFKYNDSTGRYEVDPYILPSLSDPAHGRRIQHRDIEVNDMNNDGFLDFVIGGEQNRLYIYDTASSQYIDFSDKRIDESDSTSPYYLPFGKFSTVDIDFFHAEHADSDSYLDIAISNTSEQDRVFISRPREPSPIRWFEDATTTNIPPDGEMGYGVALGDINGDELPDLILANSMASNKLYINKGRHEMLNHYEFRDATEDDKDGVTPKTPEIFRNIYKDSGYGFYQNMMNFSDVKIFDANDDGWNDVYFGVEKGASDSTLRDRLFLNYGETNPGSFEEVTDFTDDPDILNRITMAIELEDINEDGFLDLVLASYGTTGSRHFGSAIYYSNGDGTFTYKDLTSSKHTSRLSMESDIAVCDLNLNGYLDIVIACGGNTPEDIVFLQNPITGDFTEQIDLFTYDEITGDLFSANANTISVACGDLDGDDYGYPEIIFGNGVYDHGEDCGAKNTVLKNNGDLTFTDMTDEWFALYKIDGEKIFFNDVPGDIKIFDFDDDGDNDILFGNFTFMTHSFLQTWDLIYLNELDSEQSRFYATPYFTRNPFSNNHDTTRLLLDDDGNFIEVNDGQTRFFYRKNP